MIDYSKELDYSKLNDHQLSAVKASESKVLVLSGAAVGKTAVITYRVDYLINHLNCDPRKILVITFTRLAAEEMKNRINAPHNLFIGTMHSYAYITLLKYDKSIVEDLQNKYFIDSTLESNAEEIFYSKLIEKLTELLKEGKISTNIDHILVDEFQDISEEDDNFLNALNSKNYYYVGDDNQSIYGFKGCTNKYIRQLYNGNEFKSYTLTDNYRNSKKVYSYATLALDLMKTRIDRECNLINNAEGYVKIINYNKLYDYIKDNLSATPTIEYNKETGKVDFTLPDIKYKDWMIITRTNQDKDDIIKMLKKLNIPYRSFVKSSFETMKDLSDAMDSDTVKVLTVHSSKGLESKNVIYIDFHSKNVFDRDEKYDGEELRIEYVGMTRAMEKLILVDKVGD